MIKTKRVYEEADKIDGTRILVDRFWPRGLSKDKAKVDLWLKDIAPSDELRKWFAHEPEKWAEFKHQYFKELKGKQEQVNLLKEKVHSGGNYSVVWSKGNEIQQCCCLKGISGSRINNY